MKIVECVPNFSEGRDHRVIDAIADAVRSVSGVKLLDVDPGAATNRTVYTFAGEPEAVLEAAFQCIRRGVELIDMRGHKGEHARQGACDVCPFVPISGVTLEECAELARRLGRRVGDELQLPVYLYAEAAVRPERRRLPDIRAGEYEALEGKLQQPEWKPDFGPVRFDAKAGAVVTGARGLLIAYNVNLNTASVSLAKKIAFEIRETGKLRKDPAGRSVIGADGKPERIPGLFKSVQATGWFIPEYNRAQVTINILDIDASPLHKVYDACCDLASRLGCRVTGSEVVGLVPERVLLEAGRHFLQKQGATVGVSDREVLHVAALSLGLSDVTPFDPSKKIIEERFRGPEPLVSMTVKAFAAELASHSSAPGGGSVAALSGALSAGLASMVAALTHEKKGCEDRRAEMEAVGVKAQELMSQQLRAVDEDTAAFKRVMDCFGMPKATPEQQAARKAALEAANKAATLEPLGTLERTLPTLDCALAAAERGNPNSLSDAGVAGLMARSAALGAYYNVLINLPGIADEAWRRDVRLKADRLLAEAQAKAERLEKLLLTKLA